MTRPWLFLLPVLALLAACTSEIDPATMQSGIGNFRLDRVVVIVDEPEQGYVISREADEAYMKAALEEALTRRFGRFEGDSTYSIGLKVTGYVLARRGIPVIASPRSLLGLNVNVYDSVPRRLNEAPKQMVVFERAGGDQVLGSGYTQTGEEQLAEMAENAAIEIERWLRENEAWFGGPEARPEGALPAVSAAAPPG
ncbi:MAG: hypothetical protein ACK5IB_12300 [Qingshengfaniella sp.]